MDLMEGDFEKMTMIESGHFEVYLDKNKQWRWRLRDQGQRIIASSVQSYLSAVTARSEACHCGWVAAKAAITYPKANAT